jgi:hypothetical protein
MGMTDVGLQLRSLTAYHHNPEWLERMLNSINAAGLIRIKKVAGSNLPALVAEFDTPIGKRSLSSALT